MMEQRVQHYLRLFKEDNITTVYSGPLWQGGIERLAEMLQTRLHHEELSPVLSQSIFSVFIEQMNNMLMYSPKTAPERAKKPVTNGTFILGTRGKGYFLQTGNMVSNEKIATIRNRIDHLNTLDSAALRKFYREKMRSGDDNPDSKGAGLGLIEIARRASSKIEYSFLDCGEGFSFFEMYVAIGEDK